MNQEGIGLEEAQKKRNALLAQKVIRDWNPGICMPIMRKRWQTECGRLCD